MQVKAVIMRPDRTNDIVVVKKRKIEGKTFKYDKAEYFLHPDRFQVTWTRFLGFKKYFATYYYKQGVCQPLPVPDFPEITEADLALCKCEGETHDTECRAPAFKGAIDLGISGEELAAIFNPWFYRIIANIGPDKMSQIQFYVTLGIAAAAVYLIYLVTGMQGELESTRAALEALQASHGQSAAAPGAVSNASPGTVPA